MYDDLLDSNKENCICIIEIVTALSRSLVYSYDYINKLKIY